jgi:hypothetical protein
VSKYAYVNQRFKAESLALLTKIDEICTTYMQQGFVLTLRQLYYQLVSRNIIPNTERSYKNVGNLVNDGRMAGYIDWNAIEDRTREFIARPKWGSGSEILSAVADQYHQDLWANQEYRPFVLVEKEALAGVLEGICYEMDVPLLACRGYPSVTVVRSFALGRIRPAVKNDQIPMVIHLGDHDPSGIDMTRDLEDRLETFCGGRVELKRIALNFEQVEELNLPPNPAKMTDARFEGYAEKYGNESWELDAIEPNALVEMVKAEIETKIDEDKLEETQDEIKRVKSKLKQLADEFE